MDARTDAQSIALAVDLDGTLIAADLLWECVFSLLRRNPFFLFAIVFWLATGGKRRLKAEVFARVSCDPASLPYRADVLEFIRQEKAKGRKIILATASGEKHAQAIADHLGLFDGVMGSDKTTNLKAGQKASRLKSEFGDAGFDYMGNSADDLPVFDAARQAIVVAPDAAARKWASDHDAEILADSGPATIKTWLKLMRVHQWAKNLLVFVAPILDHQLFGFSGLLHVVGAFFAFSLLASAVYIFNDLFDLAMDRAHPTKRKRPLAAGILSPGKAVVVALCLMLAAGAITLFMPLLFAAVLGVYFVATWAYSLKIKRFLLLDVLTLAGLYTIRVIAGMAVITTEPSFWLLAFSLFFFLSLALVKRYVELDQSGIAERERLSGRGYRPEDKEIIAQSGVASGFASVVVLALYLQSDAVFSLFKHPWMIWPLCPLVLYIILRVWILAKRQEFNEDPVVFITTDWRSQIMIGLGAVLMLFAGLFQYGGIL